jgi:hypothetical protein
MVIVVEGASASSQKKKNSTAEMVRRTISDPNERIVQLKPYPKYNMNCRILKYVRKCPFGEVILFIGKSLGAIRVCNFLDKYDLYALFRTLLIDPHQPLKYRAGKPYRLKSLHGQRVITTFQRDCRPTGSMVIGGLNVQQKNVDHFSIVHSEMTKQLLLEQYYARW